MLFRSRTLNIFSSIEEVKNIVISVNSEYEDYVKNLLQKYVEKKTTNIVLGGKERQNSVYNALTSPYIDNSEIILIHDAVRPFASKNLIKKIIYATNEYGAAIPGLKPKETIKKVNLDHFVDSTINRDKLINVQTPQGFKKDLILKAHNSVIHNNSLYTDDASIIELFGYKIKVVEGEETNIKITNPIDFLLSEALLKNDWFDKVQEVF